MTERQAVAEARRLTGWKVFAISRRGHTDAALAAARAALAALPPRPEFTPETRNPEGRAARREWDQERDRLQSVAYSYRRALGVTALFGFTELVGCGQTWDDALGDLRRRLAKGHTLQAPRLRAERER